MRILLIEDDPQLCEAVGLQLRAAGYEADTCPNGADALYYAMQQSYNVIILDRMLPEMDGLTLLGLLRSQGVTTPVIMATALDGVSERIRGLDAGADDYIVKPYSIEELLARIRALTRRPGRIEEFNLHFANLILDADRHELRAGEETVSLSKRETSLLSYFVINGGQVLPRAMILSHVWGPDSEVEEGNLDNYIYFLRRRLKAVKAQAVIKTIHGVGYRLEEINV